jgi:hypothetical protein
MKLYGNVYFRNSCLEIIIKILYLYIILVYYLIYWFSYIKVMDFYWMSIAIKESEDRISQIEFRWLSK